MQTFIAKLNRILLLITACTTLFCSWTSYADVAEQVPVYKIGVLAFRGEEKALKRWLPTAEYLNQRIPDASFIVVPLDLEQLRHAVEKQKVDFVITNTGQYVEMEAFYGVSRIATVKNNINGQVSTSFGAVIFARADRSDINTLDDIKGKRFMGVKRTGFGGFQMAWREMLEHGVDPFRDLASLEFSGFPQDEVAYAVRDGLVDVGTFRSETLEQMAEEGKIRLSDFKILHPQQNPNYKVLLSTRLYPVWPFARLNHTSRELSEKVASVLLSMPPDSEAAISSEIMGWTIPVDYQPVHELMRELRVGPYAGLDDMSWAELIKRYWMWLTAIGITLMLLTIVTLTLRKTNRKLQDTQRQLQKHQQELVDTVHARTADLVVMRDQALAASEAKSLFLSKVSHELRTPLNAIIGYTEIIFDELREGNRRIDIQDVDKVRISALHLLSIITDLLDITRLENGTAYIRKTTFSISQMIGDVMSRAQPLAKKNGNRIEIRNHLGHDQVETDKGRLQDALDHVIDNACKYTSEGIIAIDIQQHKEGENTWLDFRVIDNGIGISLEQQERIFNVFVQGDDSTTRRFDGLGLGLAKSRGYCRLMGGDITLNTEEGRGSEFVISIPVKVINESHYQVSA
ncbi:PhnD/SsuA/transferrin family substrate-binding protein [Kaarinaea lacus]